VTSYGQDGGCDIISHGKMRPSLFCGCCTRLEHSSMYAKNCSFTYNVQASPQNRTV